MSTLDFIMQQTDIEEIAESLPVINKEVLKDFYKRWIQLMEGDKKFRRKLKQVGKLSVLFCGFPKSGNTWARLVTFNYFNIKYNNADTTLTFDELNSIQAADLGEGITDQDYGSLGDDIPYIARTHARYRRVYSDFDIIVYIYRNPLDSLISRYAKDINYKYLETEAHKKSIDEFVLDNLSVWINHFKYTYYKSDIQLSYIHRKDDPYYEYKRLVKVIDNKLCEESLKASINISSFENIKQMADKKNQKGGMHNKELEDNFNFARSGKVGQFYNKLEDSTIRTSKDILRRNGVETPIL